MKCSQCGKSCCTTQDDRKGRCVVCKLRLNAPEAVAERREMWREASAGSVGRKRVGK